MPCLAAGTEEALQRPAAPTVQSALVVEDAVEPSIKLVLNADSGKIEVDAPVILSAVDSWLKPDLLAWLKTQVKNGLVSIDTLRKIGINGIYEEAKHKLTVEVMVQSRRAGALWLDGSISAHTPTLVVEDVVEPGPLVKLSSDPNQIQVDASHVLRSIEPWLKDDLLAQLRTQVQDGMLSFEALHKVGARAVYDEAKQLLTVEVTEQSRRTTPTANDGASTRSVPTLIVENAAKSNVTIVPNSNPDLTKVDASVVLSHVEPWLKPEKFAQLKAKSQDKMLSLDDLRKAGLNGTYDAATGRFVLEVQPQTTGETATNAPEDLFQQVFKKKKPLPPALKVGLVVQGQDGPEINAKLNSDPALTRIEAEPILRMLKQWITADRLSWLQGQVEDGTLTWGTLAVAGFTGGFDERDLKIKIHVPVSMRKLQIKNLSGRGEVADPPDLIRSSPVSGYLNFNSSDQYQSGSLGGSSFGVNSLATTFDGALNLNSLVVEGQANYDQLSNSPWRRGDLRVVKDVPSRLIRVAAGDLSFTSFGLAITEPIGGIGVSTEFGMRPNLLVTALNHREIELKFPSTVNIYRNEVLIQTLKLPEGKFDLQDIPAVTGANDLKIEVIDPAGRSETVHLSQYYDSGFLAPGLHQFSYNVGFPWQEDGSHRDYDTGQTTALFSHRVGIFTELTVGAFLEHRPGQDVIGGELLFPFFWGALQTDLAAGKTTLAGYDKTGEAIRLHYSYSAPVNKSFNGTRNLSLEVETHTSDFLFFGSSPSAQPFIWNFFTSYSEPLARNLNLNFGGGYTAFNDPVNGSAESSFVARTGLSKSFERGTTGTLSLSYSDAPTRVEFAGAASVTFTMPEKKQTLRAAYDSDSDRSTLGWNYNPNTAIGATRAAAELNHDHSGRGLAGTVGYLGNREELVLQENLQDSVAGGANAKQSDALTSTTRLTASTAIVFVGTQVALSRNVQDSFVIIKSGRALASQTLEVDPYGDGTYLAQSDFLGSAVLTNLGGYQKNEIRLSDAQFTGSRGLPKNHYTVQPTYKSGAIVSLASDFNFVIQGKLVDARGAPLARVSGEIVDVESAAKDARRVTFFTNRVGLFQAEGLKPGKYEMSFFDDKLKAYPLVVPDAAEDFVNFGVLTISSQSGKETPQ